VVAPLPQFDQTGEQPGGDSDFSIQGHETQLARVTILMCTYNGERFLAQQLDSIARQSYREWTVVVSDDGSTDATLDILRQYSAIWGEGRLTILQGPKRGFAANFISVACDAPVQSQFYAWADQDDIWQANKLESAVKVLEALPSGLPALYCGRTELIGDSGTVIGRSPLFSRPASFGNALVQSLAGGNTMVFNHLARDVLCHAGGQVDIVSHDWWAYLLITGVGGEVVYDASPSILYRQHEANLIGANSGVRARIMRLRMMSTGRFRDWNDKNIAALETVRSSLSADSLQTFEQFKKARDSKGFGRFLWLYRANVYRQTCLGNLGLMLAAVLNRI